MALDLVQSPSSKLVGIRRGEIGWLTFNNPVRHNAVSMDMWEAVPAVLEALEEDDTVRVIVVTGAGNQAFVAGADISEFEENRSDPGRGRKYEKLTEQAFERIAASPKPVIARIDGYCIGAGLGIALACDMRIASDLSTFGIPAAKLGLAYSASGTRRLVQTVGPAVAKEIFFTGRQYSAGEALERGLLNDVVKRDALDRTVKELCATIASNAPLTVQTAKRVVDEVLKPDEMFDAELCAGLIDRCFASEDYAEGRAAFRTKRRPVFKGR